MLRHYLGPAAQIVGIDIDDSARTVAGRARRRDRRPGGSRLPGACRRRHGPFDIVIDDGGHTMRQQIRSIETLFPLLADGGVYLVEDCHTSYWTPYARSGRPGGDVRRLGQGSARRPARLPPFDRARPRGTLADGPGGVHAYDSVVVLDKARRSRPFSEVSGTSDYINVNRRREPDRTSSCWQPGRPPWIGHDEAEEDAARRVEDAERRLAARRSRGDARPRQAAHDEVRILRAELVAASQNAARARADLERPRRNWRTRARSSWVVGRSSGRCGRAVRGRSPPRCAGPSRSSGGDEGAVPPIRQARPARPRREWIGRDGRRRRRPRGGAERSTGSPSLPIGLPPHREPLRRRRPSPPSLAPDIASSSSARPKSAEPLDWREAGPPALTVLRRPNVGYDFGSWATALDRYPAIADAEPCPAAERQPGRTVRDDRPAAREVPRVRCRRLGGHGHVAIRIPPPELRPGVSGRRPSGSRRCGRSGRTSAWKRRRTT